MRFTHNLQSSRGRSDPGRKQGDNKNPGPTPFTGTTKSAGNSGLGRAERPFDSAKGGSSMKSILRKLALLGPALALAVIP
ncbi:MAG TPA: hypothetical protein VLT16_15945, partial [Candidatus Limnocylindrales bacterium]|nr:hypothetical protein [Candidatus Limnocylindrales bacterium]